MMRLTYTAVLQQTDASGHPSGDVFTFTGSQSIASFPPANSDLTAAAVAMGADISAQMISGTGYANQAQQAQTGG